MRDAHRVGFFIGASYDREFHTLGTLGIYFPSVRNLETFSRFGAISTWHAWKSNSEPAPKVGSCTVTTHLSSQRR
jgi:hypothetical protein